MATELIAWAIALSVLAYFIVGLADPGLDLLPKNISKHFDDPGEREMWLIRVAAGLLFTVGVVSYFTMESGFLRDFSTEMVGIGLGVLGIDELNRRRSEQELKQQTFRQIRFSSNAFAIEALEVARDAGWLDEIICPKTNLHGAHLEGANLQGANLEGADLWVADLTGANLRGANLQGAVLTGARLQNAILSTWPEGFDAKAAGARNWDEITEEERAEWRAKYRPKQ